MKFGSDLQPENLRTFAMLGRPEMELPVSLAEKRNTAIFAP